MNEKRMNRNASALIVLCWSVYMVCYIGRKNFQACMPAMIENGYSESVLGAALTGYLICYAIGQFVNGLVGDKVSPKYMLFTGLIGAGIANLAMGLNTVNALFAVFWCFNGFFNSMLWSPLLRAYAIWLNDDRRRGASVWISATIPVGAIVSTVITSLTLKWSGNNWRLVFFICSGILITMAFIWLFGITAIKKYINWMTGNNNKPVDNTSEIESEPVQKKYSLWQIIWGGGVLCVVFGIMFNGIIKDAVDAWTSTYIYDFFGVSASDAALITTVLPIVNLSGAFVANFINRRITGNEITTCGVLFAVSTVTVGLLLLIGKYNVILAVLLIAITTACMLGVNTMFLTFIPLGFASTGRTSSLTGFFNSCSYAAAAVAAYLIGLMQEYDVSWNIIIMTWLAVAAMGTLLCFVGRSTYAHNRHKFE
ncbi:MAG: MFS transporter [Ruminococcaceae bacterium]|nr:MFS transporter [Oscillospiraceae bacterium]